MASTYLFPYLDTSLRCIPRKRFRATNEQRKIRMSISTPTDESGQLTIIHEVKKCRFIVITWSSISLVEINTYRWTSVTDEVDELGK